MAQRGHGANTVGVKDQKYSVASDSRLCLTPDKQATTPQLRCPSSSTVAQNVSLCSAVPPVNNHDGSNGSWGRYGSCQGPKLLCSLDDTHHARAQLSAGLCAPPPSRASSAPPVVVITVACSAVQLACSAASPLLGPSAPRAHVR
jgi:hypothetical protein